MDVTPGFPASPAASAQRSTLRPRSAVAQAAFCTPDGDREVISQFWEWKKWGSPTSKWDTTQLQFGG